MPPKGTKTRRQSGDINPGVEFPPCDKFWHPTKLPTYQSVIGVLQSLAAAKIKHEDAVREVAKMVYSKWYHDSVYCVHINTVKDRLRKTWEIFREGRKRFQEGRKSGTAIEAYSALVKNKDCLYDIGYQTAKTEALRQACVNRCKAEWGVTMSKKERRRRSTTRIRSPSAAWSVTMLWTLSGTMPR